MKTLITRVFHDTPASNRKADAWILCNETRGYRLVELASLPLALEPSGEANLLQTRRWRYTMRYSAQSAMTSDDRLAPMRAD